MDIFQAIILGIIQGITEWLPISSSGHLTITQSLFGLHAPLAFDVLLHIGSLLVIMAFFWKDIVALISGIFRGKQDKLRTGAYLVVASIPIALVGFFLNERIAAAFSSLLFVGIALLFTGLLLFLSKYSFKNKKGKLTWKSIIIMSVFQALALFPGVSRSGSTISSGMILGVKKEEAARFSFLLFIPAILGALLLEFNEILMLQHIGISLVGLLVSAVVGYLCLSLLMHIIKKGKFFWFSIYCFVLGIITILITV